MARYHRPLFYLNFERIIMKRNIIYGTVFLAFLTTAGSIFLFVNKKADPLFLSSKEKKKYSREEKAFFTKERFQYEYDLLKDPITGKIPYGIRDKELAFAKKLPAKEYDRGFGILSGTNLNTYTPVGPNNIGGRTRAVAYDVRFGTAGNQVIIAGSVSGGILRSVDGGANWIRVNPENDIHNLTALAQDPRVGLQDTWYAGGGEPIANSANAQGAPYLGFGIWKSINNGLTWTKLPLQVRDIDGVTVLGGGTLEAFDNPFDFVHRIVVNPANGHVYVAGHRRLVRSTDAGTTWDVVFTGTSPASSDNGQIDIISTNGGKLYLGVNGGFVDPDRRGVWTSTNGLTWTRIAGGSTLNVDSVSGWQGNDPGTISRRIVLALAPSNQNLVYISYENGLAQDGSNPKPEVDMYKLDVSSGSNVWTNLSANMPDFPGQLDGVDPFETQDGYNLCLFVKPDDTNAVFLGGSNFYRSTSGFSNTTATAWIGGYNQDFASGLKIYPNNHPDIHNVVFDPSNPNRAICANDGGLQSTTNIMATGALNPVSWTMAPNYQTLQYYHVAIDPASGQFNFIGGAQDNGTYIRIDTGNNHIKIFSGDGGVPAIASVTQNAFTFYGSSQFGQIYRDITNTFTNIRPANLTLFPGLTDAYGEYVTYFKMDFDNPEDIYYANFNRLFRTKNASTVTSSTWQELTGVRSAVNPSNPASGTNIAIRALDVSRGPYFPSHALYIGTSNGRVYRLNDPRNTSALTSPVNITPPGLTGSVSDIAVNPNNDEEILVVASNYGTTNIFWTNNAKNATPTWRVAEGNLTLPSIRSCAIVVKKDAGNQPSTEYYVGTSVGLYSSVDIATILQSGGSVTWVREGGNVLNYAIVNSMDYRPQDNTLLLGTHGNGMFFGNTGTPDFRPNLNTGVDDPVRNDKNFIRQATPSFVKDRINYRIGNMFTIKKITIQIYNVTGQLLYRRETAYRDGQLDVVNLSKGSYILQITSQDNKQQFVQKFIKD